MEKYQIFQNLCQIGIAIFSVLTILSTYGAYHFSVLKESSIKKSVTPQKDSIPSHATTYHMSGGDLVQGNKVVKIKKEEINAPTALIVTKDQTGGINTVNFFQNEYKPLESEALQKIDTKLIELVKKYPNPPRTIVEVESGNSQRNKIAQVLGAILSKRNLGAYPEGNTYMGRFPDDPISVFVNPNSRKFAEELLKSLDLFIAGEFRIIDVKEFPQDFIRLYINGQPLFDTTGKVKVQ